MAGRAEILAQVEIRARGLLVAAQARLARAIVVTHDSDFDHLDVVREDWIASAS